jgi:hypothetical protein
LRPWKRLVLMVSYVYAVDCGNWRQHAAIRDPIRARDDVRDASTSKCKPRKISMRSSGRSGEYGAERRQRRIGGKLLRNLQPCPSSEAALRFLLSNFWSPALHFTRSIKTLIITLSPFLYVNPLKIYIILYGILIFAQQDYFLTRKQKDSAGCTACYQPFTPPFSLITASVTPTST